MALYLKLSETGTKNLKDNFLECKTCGQIFNTGLESTIPGEPGSSEKVKLFYYYYIKWKIFDKKVWNTKKMQYS